LLNKHIYFIPDYNFNLQDLPELKVEFLENRSLSPLEASTVQLEDLNTNVEKTWGSNQINSKISPQSDCSDDTVKALK